MSQQKFASNVIEKCLAFGTLEERQILVNEMLGTSEENEPLQVWTLPSLIIQYFNFSNAGAHFFFMSLNLLSAMEIGV